MRALVQLVQAPPGITTEQRMALGITVPDDEPTPVPPPADITMRKFEGSTGRTQIDVTFPLTVPLSSKVWFTAFWFNPRKESGPATRPVSAYLDSGMDEMAPAA